MHLLRFVFFMKQNYENINTTGPMLKLLTAEFHEY